MKPSAFFQKPETRRLLERAARGAAAPLAIHFRGGEDQELRIAGYGRCEACRYVQEISEGRAACREARFAAAQTAARLSTPVPFICRLGFACITASALPDPALGFILTLGPYCPIEGAPVLENDAVEGLKSFSGAEPPDDFRGGLLDIHTVPASAISAIMEWTLEALALIWQDGQASTPEPEAEPAKVPARRKRHTPLPDPYQAAPIAAALAGGKSGQARALIRAALSESRSSERGRIAVKRARVVAVVAAVLEAAERAGMNTASCWERLADLPGQVQQARTDLQLASAATAVLAPLKHKTALGTPSPTRSGDFPEIAGQAALAPPASSATGEDYAELSQIVIDRLVEGITLGEVAARLGQNPSAITHRLQRKFGMSYSEYVGRLRVDKAKELLRRTRLSVTEIARRVGIDDPSNFAKLFRKFEAMTPLEYQKRFQRKKNR